MAEDASTEAQEPEIGGYPWTDWRCPPAGGTEVKYAARYHRIVRGNKDGNVWWDLIGLFDTPEEVVEAMAKFQPDAQLYVIYRVTATEKIVDVSRMGYEPGDPHYGITLD